MVTVSFNKGTWDRKIAKEAQLLLKNRYYEQNPVLADDGTALIARPGLKKYLSVGTGPIRGIYSQSGSFADSLFVVSGSEWYKIDVDDTVTLIQTGLAGGEAPISMAGTGNIGTTPEFMFLADGTTLYCYVADGYAFSILSGTPANNDTLQLGTVYYKMTTGSVDTGTPAGTLANPWLILVGGSVAESFQNIAAAFNADGNAGVQYSTALLTANTQARAQNATATNIYVQAIDPGVDGNFIATLETGGMTWTGTLLSGGGTPVTFVVPTPDGVGMISLGYIASYVVCVPAQGQGVNGRFYWIDPGETNIDPLNFATAERAPDPIYGVVVFGDQFWLPGQSTTEVWYFTGDPDAPVLRLQGITFDRGTWAGTALQVKDSMIITDSDGGVFQIKGGDKRISNPSIEERIRKAIEAA